jgi:hypothetical protein
MRIKLNGGYIETTDETYTDSATLERKPFWRAVSDYDATVALEKFYTKALAEFSVWVIAERVEAQRQRMG